MELGIMRKLNTTKLNSRTKIRSNVFGTNMLGMIVLSTIALSACTPTLPAGPSVAVMPGKGKPFEAFQNDNAVCMQFASGQIGVDPQQNAQNNAAAGALTGAVLGAAAGAALGDSSRAAGTGAGAGLLLGSAIGNNNAVRSSSQLQHRYDVAYEQCMYAKGNQLPRMEYSRYRHAAYPPPGYSTPPDYSPAPDYYPPPAYYPPPRY
jgi:hypothetical protein